MVIEGSENLHIMMFQLQLSHGYQLIHGSVTLLLIEFDVSSDDWSRPGGPHGPISHIALVLHAVTLHKSG